MTLAADLRGQRRQQVRRHGETVLGCIEPPLGAEAKSRYEPRSRRQVVVHSVENDDRKTAVEIDRVGDGGLHEVEGVVVGLDRRARTLIVELPDDTWVTLRLTDRAAHHVALKPPPATASSSITPSA